MEFDPKNIFTALNADGLKKGDKVLTAYGLLALKDLVAEAVNYSQEELLDAEEEVWSINPESSENRIITNEGCFPFAYLIKRADVKKYRPYKDCHEMITDFRKRYNWTAGGFPLIWVMNKFSKTVSLVTDFYNDKLYLSDVGIFMSGLYDSYTYADGAPCGVQKD